MPSSIHAPRSPNPVDVHVGTRIRIRRKILKMTQEGLGELLGVTFQQVQKYERGANRVGASRLWKLAEVLDVPISFFFEGLSERIASGMAENEQSEIKYNFYDTAEGLELAQLMSRIKSPAVRKQILELARSLADKAAD